MTVPHTSGTITLVKGSADVTGVDTAWAAALIVGGTLYVNVPNVGAVGLPITTVDSNTKITAAIPWNGANGTYTYALVRDGSYERQSVENAIQIATLLNEIRSLALTNLSTLTPAVDKLPYFGAGGAGALADFNAAARAFLAGGVLAEAQFPGRLKGSLPFTNDMNLSTATGFVYGGGTTLNNPVPPYSFVGYVLAVNPLYFVQRVIVLGELSNGRNMEFVRECSNGVFTQWSRVRSTQFELDALYLPERGFNANGDYVRFKGGTQICWSRRTMTDVFQSRNWSTWTFPAAFASGQLPTVTHVPNLNSISSGTNNVNNATSLYVPTVSDVSASSVLLQITSGQTLLNWQQVNTYATAIGRWF